MLKSDRILALDIGASSLKMAEFIPLKSGGLELIKHAIASIGLDPHSDADRSAFMVAAIQEMMQEHEIKPGPVLLSVSGQSVFSRFVKLPPVDEEKVYQIVAYEAAQNVPFPIDEVVWDYQLIGNTEGDLDVMLAAIKGDIINELTDSVERAGLLPDLVDVAPMALYNAVRYNYEDHDHCTLIVDMGARSTDLIFLERNRVFSRSIPVAGNAITQQIMREFELSFHDAEDMKKAHAFVAWGGNYESPPGEVADKVSKSVRSVMTRLHAEINRSINFYRGQQDGSQPERLLLTGGSSVIPYTDVFFKDKLKAEVDYLNPFMNVAVSDAISTEQIGNDAHMLGEVVGLGLRRLLTCPIEINLMPPKVLADKTFRKKQPMLLTAAFSLVVVLAVWCVYFVWLAKLGHERLVLLDTRLEKLQRVENEMRGPQRQITEVLNKIESLHELVESKGRWLAILEEIHRHLPDGVWLASIVPVVDRPEAETDVSPAMARRRGPETEQVASQDEGGTINKIEVLGLGYTDKIRDDKPIFELRDALRNSHFFTSDTQFGRSPTLAPNSYAREFSIILVLEQPISL
jgi:type IV pilus assembly protein PilM